jgi:hypothetical protein
MEYALVCKEHFAENKTGKSTIRRTTYYVFGFPVWRYYKWYPRPNISIKANNEKAL